MLTNKDKSQVVEVAIAAMTNDSTPQIGEIWRWQDPYIGDNVHYYYVDYEGAFKCLTDKKVPSIIRASRIQESTQWKRATKEEIEGLFNAPSVLVDDRRIIGYKAPYPLFEGQIGKDEVYTKKDTTSSYYHCTGFAHVKFILPKEIVETWEPVYEELSTKLKLGKKGTTVTIGKKLIQFGGNKNARYAIDGINLLLKRLNNGGIDSYPVELCTEEYFIKVSFGKDLIEYFTISELRRILDTYKDYNK